jgi:cyclopropane-fatty-acyl-phospholipid synthase
MHDATISSTVLSDAETLSADNIGRFIRGLPGRAQLALKGLLHMRAGTLTIRLPDGRTVRVEGRVGGPEATLVLHNWNLPQRAFVSGTIGVAESYMDGDWESPDVTAFLELFIVNMDLGESYASGTRGLLYYLERARHWLRANTRRQARKNISAHYDLGNAFYEEWLDPTMTYSSALYQTGANDLQSAQTAKYRALAHAMGIARGDHVLEIGSGWGGFAEYAAREIGCRVTGLTISQAQLDYATKRIEAAGLSDLASFKFQDYRDETGRYDHIVSIEMFEAVGEQFWQGYFHRLRACLKPGGRAGIQAITISESAFPAYRANPDFIQKYVFPGGMLPTERHLQELGTAADLSIIDHRAFASDYARTLAAWRERFWERWETIRGLGFDTRFKRLWEFYFHYCEAGFRAENINVRQIVYA